MDSVGDGIASIEAGVAEIHSWTNMNMLKLSEGKTAVLFIPREGTAPIPPTMHATISDCAVAPVSQAHDLGILFDQHMTMIPWISTMCRTGHHHLGTLVPFRNTSQGSLQSVLCMPSSHLGWTMAMHFCGVFPKSGCLVYRGYRTVLCRWWQELQSRTIWHQC